MLLSLYLLFFQTDNLFLATVDIVSEILCRLKVVGFNRVKFTV